MAAEHSSKKSAPNLLSEIIRCANFSAIKHKDQRRKSPDEAPYINHPIGVANILCNESNVVDIVVIQAALLHDTVEDTDTSLDEIEAEFGLEVSKVVAEVTDDKSLDKHERKEAQVQHARSSSHRAKLVKLADKLYNLRDLENVPPVGWSEQRVKQYFEWSFRVVSGLRGTDEVLETALAAIFARHGLQ